MIGINYDEIQEYSGVYLPCCHVSFLTKAFLALSGYT